MNLNGSELKFNSQDLPTKALWRPTSNPCLMAPIIALGSSVYKFILLVTFRLLNKCENVNILAITCTLKLDR